MRESVYTTNINADKKHTVKQCATCLEYQQTQPQKGALYYEIPYKLWEIVSADIFMVNNKTILCIVDYNSKFPIVKKVGSLSADDLVQTAKLMFAEYGIPKNCLRYRNKFHIRDI